MIKISLIKKCALKNDGPQILSGPPGTVPGVPPPPLNTALIVSKLHNVTYIHTRIH